VRVEFSEAHREDRRDGVLAGSSERGGTEACRQIRIRVENRDRLRPANWHP
jgi:hypothetical protein